ncbi:MAG: Hsp20/alpha crystallin family protein [Planctomycetota bacterium]|jgi:HSP20 family protein
MVIETNANEATRELLVQPPADVASTKEGVRLALEMPGAVSGSISVTVEEDILTVRAERPELPEGHRLLRRESSPGVYARSFRLSKDLAREGLVADFRLGVLTVFVPRAEHTIPRRIEVRTDNN